MDVDPELTSLVRNLDIDEEYLRHVIDHLTGIGSSPVGFRTTGTDEDTAVAAFVAAELRGAGLHDVAVEGVEVDAWRFLGAGVSAVGTELAAIAGCSFGGVPGTAAGGVTARLVDAGDPLRRRLDRLDLRGAIVLVDWRRQSLEPAAVVLELALRGAVGMLLTCPANGAWYQSPGAIGAFNGQWPAGAPPMVLIAKEDAGALRAALRPGGLEVTMTLDVTRVARATGSNVVGYLPGDLPGPIVVGAHHDAWFSGAFDNTSGVAALLALARALVASGHRPRHTLCFSTRTAEEYGIADSMYDWCIGAWEQVQTTHPAWSTKAPFHLCVEASGHRSLRAVVEAPVELATWARRVCRAADREGWTPTGWRIAPPVSGTEQWPFLVSGVPGVASYSWERSFAKTDYHTQYDTTELIDFGYLAAQTRLHALLLLDADRDPDAVLEHRARGRQLARIAASTGHAGLAAAAERHASARGRGAFSAVGRGLLALDAHLSPRYPHHQTLVDLRALDAALAALATDDPATHDLAAAARALRGVGGHALFGYLSHEALAAHHARSEPSAVTRSWASASHLTPSPHVWGHLATLYGEPGAEPYGPWVRESLHELREQAQERLWQRLDDMARAV